MRKYMGLALGLCTMASCAPQEVDLVYDCQPSGATVYEESMGEVGTCPVTLKYSSHDSAIRDGQIYTRKIRVLWASGAALLVQPTVLAIPENSNASMTFIRPPDFPYIEKDEKASKAFEESLMPPVEKYVMSPNQDPDGFAALNHSMSCAFEDLIESVYAHCP